MALDGARGGGRPGLRRREISSWVEVERESQVDLVERRIGDGGIKLYVLRGVAFVCKGFGGCRKSPVSVSLARRLMLLLLCRELRNYLEGFLAVALFVCWFWGGECRARGSAGGGVGLLFLHLFISFSLLFSIAFTT